MDPITAMTMAVEAVVVHADGSTDADETSNTEKEN
jgi:hypothetical protein